MEFALSEGFLIELPRGAVGHRQFANIAYEDVAVAYVDGRKDLRM